MFPKHLVFCVLAAGACTAALAQWKWVDKDGRTVFSDRPPPADVPAKSIQQRERAAAATGKMLAPDGGNLDAAQLPDSQAQPAANSPASKVHSGKPVAPSELATLRQKASEAAANQRALDATATREAQTENCKIARQSLAMLNSGVRVRKTNAAGEREFLDDAQRDAERRKANEMVAQNCL